MSFCLFYFEKKPNEHISWLSLRFQLKQIFLFIFRVEIMLRQSSHGRSTRIARIEDYRDDSSRKQL